MCDEIRGHAELAFSFSGPGKAWSCLSLGTAARVLVQTLTGELASKLWRDVFTPHLRWRRIDSKDLGIKERSPSTYLTQVAQQPGVTSSATIQTQSQPLRWPTLPCRTCWSSWRGEYPCHRISMTCGSFRISQRSFREDQIMTVCQKPEAASHCNEHLIVNLIE